MEKLLKINREKEGLNLSSGFQIIKSQCMNFVNQLSS